MSAHTSHPGSRWLHRSDDADTVLTAGTVPGRGRVLVAVTARDITTDDDRAKGMTRTTWRGARREVAPPAQQYGWRCARATRIHAEQRWQTAYQVTRALVMLGGYNPNEEPF